jgi:outer membrane receptor protein involved in Fe transport
VVGFDTVNECAGRFGQTCGNPRPKYKWSSRLSLIDGPLTSSLRWRHVGKVKDDTGGFSVDKLKAYNLFDLAFSLDATDQVSFSFGVNNLFDKKPQLIGDNQEQANTYPSVYDVLGRDYFVSASFRF